MYIADLHIHSRFSRATSRDCDAPHLDWWARRKGIQLLGTGDFTHPAWRAELKEQLLPLGDGTYTLRESFALPDGLSSPPPRFVVTGEISSIYKRDGKTRKVHNLILLPSLEAADLLSTKLEAIGNIRSDGRPILGLDSRDLLELALDTCPEAEFIPAHIWTPHFAMFGAFSGFDSVEECFGPLRSHIHAVETGLSSDPPMNWRVSDLDGLTLVSNSDAHSPAKLGREANLLDGDISYSGLIHSIRTGQDFLGTVEFFPEEGKYHLDGHRNCGVCLTPAETLARGGLCPVCGRKLTIGVEHRVEALADRPAGFQPQRAKPFESLAPLPEVIAASTGSSPTAKGTMERYESLLHGLGPEFYILRQAPIPDISQLAGPCVAEGIRRLRLGEVDRRPGFDGEYGVISLLTPSEIQRFSGQFSLFAPEEKGDFSHKSQVLPSPAATIKAADAPPRGEELNPEQLAAVTAPEPVVAVVAGPGTGKTKTLVARVAYLVEELGVRPQEITAVTFTNQAAAEMRQRLERRLGGKRAVSPMTIGTFHAICLKLLGQVRLISRGEGLTAASQVLQSLGRKGSPKELLQGVSQVKNGFSLGEAGLDEEAYQAYCSYLAALGVLDFDDLLAEGLKVDTAGRKNFRYLLIDEFQDINDTQYALARQWSQGSRSLFVIGDPDQSIYGFRGASGRCFQRLAEDLPHLRQICLVENYRSTPQVLQAALPVIQAGKGDSKTLSPNCPPGPPVRLITAPDDFAEGVLIAKEIGRMTGGVDMLEAQRLGASQEARAFSDIAVLCRTHRQLELIESCLRHDDIPCVVSGREDFWDSDLVRGTLAFFRSVQVPWDGPALESALRLVFQCPTDLVQKALAVCRPLSSLEEPVLRDAFRGYGHLEAWLDQALSWLPQVQKEKPWRLVEHWIEQRGSSPELVRLKGAAVFHPTLDSLWNALILGQEGDLCRASGKGWQSGAVRLMTLHASKGLEFPAVLLAGLKAGSLPLETKGRPADLEEERRLFYVGMTRAKEELILTTAGEPSLFLANLPTTVRRERLTARPAPPAEQLSLF